MRAATVTLLAITLLYLLAHVALAIGRALGS